jgi:hypothetical protein
MSVGIDSCYIPPLVLLPVTQLFVSERGSVLPGTGPGSWFIRSTWFTSGLGTSGGDDEVALPVLAIICFLFLISLSSLSYTRERAFFMWRQNPNTIHMMESRTDWICMARIQVPKDKAMALMMKDFRPMGR